VAAMSQKQVALLVRPAVPVEIVYRAEINDDAEDVVLTLRAQNRKEKGLGLPLPAGGVAVFQPLGDRRLLIGEGIIRDKAVGEEVEIEAGEATQVTAQVRQLEGGKHYEAYELTVTNANSFPVRFEGEFRPYYDSRVGHVSARTIRKNGYDVWVTEVPANDSVRLRYRLIEVDED